MKRVLIVDDSKQVRERLISLLSEYPDNPDRGPGRKRE